MMAAALSIFARMAFWFGGGRGRSNPLGSIVTIASLILAPIAAMLIRFAISRTREFQADRSGAEITGQPMKLASALEKISAGAKRFPMNVNPATSQLFIENPIEGGQGSRCDAPDEYSSTNGGASQATYGDGHRDSLKLEAPNGKQLHQA